MTMNKLIIKKIGFDFNKENILAYAGLSPKEKLNKIFILANYSQLENMRMSLAEESTAIYTKKILTFDDLVSSYKDPKKVYITREQGAWIIKKILEEIQAENYSTSLGSAREILAYLLDIKSFNISYKDYKGKIKSDTDLIFIGKIYQAYENFLLDNNLEDDIGLYFDGIKNIEKDQSFSSREVVINGFVEFRKHELKLIETLKNKANTITIQYPFYTKRKNKKLEKTKQVLLDLGFELDDSTCNFEDQSLAFDIFSNEERAYKINSRLYPSSNKLEEINQLLSYIEDNLAGNSLDDFTIIIPDDYENLLKIKSKEYNIDLNIMNQEKAKSLSLIKSILNFLYLIKNDEKKKILTCLYDDNLNLKNLLDNEIDENNFLKIFRDFEYKGLFYEYSNVDNKIEKFLTLLKKEILLCKNNPLEYLRENFSKDYKLNDVFLDFKINQDEKILADYLKALEILDKVLDRVEKFSEILSISNEDIIDILVNSLEEESYYSKVQKKGVQVLKPINAIGVISPFKILCGLNYNYPTLTSKGYLYSSKFKNFHKDLGFYYEDIYEQYDNKILLYAQALAHAENLAFSYVYLDPTAKDSRSVFLNDSLKRIQRDCLNDFSDFDNLAKEEKGNLDFNYLMEDQASYINRLISLYQKRRDNFEDLNGFIKDMDKDNLYFHRREYSPRMLEYFNQCPFKYYVAYILKYKNLELDYTDSFNLDKGNFYHLVLEKFFRASDYKLLTEEQVEERLVEIIEDLTRDDKNNINLEDFQKKIYKNNLLAYIKKDLKNQKSFSQNFMAKYFEKNLKKDFNGISLFGRVDRIDQGQDNKFIVYDYKTKTIPTKDSFKNFKDIQLSLYGLMLGQENLAGISYGSIEYARLANFIFLEDYYKAGQTKEEVDEYFQDLKQLLVNIDKEIENGRFILNPSDPNVCRNCPYGLICRKEDLEANEI